MHPFLRDLKPTLHISHRGGAALFPENTLPAFREAVSRFRTDVLELDLQLTADGELVVFHDDTLDRCTDGAGPISGCTFAQLSRLDAGHRFSPDGGASFPWRGRGAVVPRLADVLRELPAVRLNAELKSKVPGAERVVASVLRAAGAVGRVCVGSERDEVARRLLAQLPEACHFYPRDALTALVLAIKQGEPVDAGEPWLVMDVPLAWQGVKLVDAPLLQAAARLGRWVNVWTVDDPADMRELVRLGAGGIMTDRPDLLRDVLDGRGPA